MLMVGIDWARHKHDAALVSSEGELFERITFRHTAEGFDAIANAIVGYEPDPSLVRVGLELHDGALLSWLLDRRYVVYGVNPKSAERARTLYRPSGAKDDRSDAFILAEMVRTDAGRLRPVRCTSPTTQALRALVRLRAFRIKERTSCAQRLRALLSDWSPTLSTLCSDLLRVAWQRDLMRAFVLHEGLAAASPGRIRRFCKRHRLSQKTSGRIEAARSIAVMRIPELRKQVIRMEITYLVEQLEHLSASIKQIEQELERRVAEHPDVAVFRSLPVKATATTAMLMAVFGEDRDDAPSWQELAAGVGMAPVTIASGQSRRVKRRRACDQVFRQGMHFFSFNSAFIKGSWAAEYYRTKRLAGVGHFTALRCLAQRWIKIIHKIWRERIPYDEMLHQERRRERLSTAA